MIFFLINDHKDRKCINDIHIQTALINFDQYHTYNHEKIKKASKDNLYLCYENELQAPTLIDAGLLFRHITQLLGELIECEIIEVMCEAP